MKLELWMKVVCASIFIAIIFGIVAGWSAVFYKIGEKNAVHSSCAK